MRLGRLEINIPQDHPWWLKYRGRLVWGETPRGNRVLWLGRVQVILWVK